MKKTKSRSRAKVAKAIGTGTGRAITATRGSVANLIGAPGTCWQIRNPPASERVLTKLVKNAPFNLPAKYLELLRLINGGEGELAVDPGWFQLWRAEVVLKRNRAYEVDRWHAGYFGFGSSGGGVMFAFRNRAIPNGRVFAIPFDSTDPEDIRVVAKDFATFVKAMWPPGPS